MRFAREIDALIDARLEARCGPSVGSVGAQPASCSLTRPLPLTLSLLRRYSIASYFLNGSKLKKSSWEGKGWKMGSSTSTAHAVCSTARTPTGASELAGVRVTPIESYNAESVERTQHMDKVVGRSRPKVLDSNTHRNQMPQLLQLFSTSVREDVN
jgi:hypothetical protein